MENLKEVLAAHKIWLESNREQGIRADLSSADLSSANLRDANLRDANLRDANLRDANLRYANLSGADLSGADLSGALAGIEKINLKNQVRTACQHENALDMSTWHTCDTTHCLAGWACVLHPQGKELEEKIGTNAAAALLFHACEGEVPNFYGSNEEAIEWLNKPAVTE